MSRNQRKRNNNLLGILIIFLLGLGLGYDLLSQDLTINGITKVKGNNWDIHFNNIVVNPDSVILSTGDSAASINQTDDTLVEYTVTLNTPGDFYEFTVDVVNAGTVDGMIGEVINKLNNTVISTTNPLPVYLDYTFSYADGTQVTPNHLLEAGDTETYKVRVEFKRDIENSELPTTDQTNTFSFGVSYVQADDHAIEVPHPITKYTINVIDFEDLEDTAISIGQEIPNTITQYATAAEAIEALAILAGAKENEKIASPIYLKHTLVNNIVTETYVEFVVTTEMANNSGMTAGTYALQGEAGLCEYDEINDLYNCAEEESQYYQANLAILQESCGSFYCFYEQLFLGDNQKLLNWSASSNPEGVVNAREGLWNCEFDEISYCFGTPTLIPDYSNYTPSH
jgi:hypothetical protein